jgi:cytochrome P450
MLEIPANHPWLKFKELADQYGPIFKLEIFGSTHVIISNANIANELLAMRGAIYSDRGQLYMLNMLTHNHDLLCSPENSYWTRGRKFANRMLTSAMAAQWEPFQAREARGLTSALVQNPENYQYWLERFTTAVSVREGFGHNFTSRNDEKFQVRSIQDRMANVERFAAPGKYLVELFPWLLYLPKPLAPFKQEADRLHKVEWAYFSGLLSEAVKKFEAGIPEDPPSFARCWLQADDRWQLSFDEMVYVIGTLYNGGAGTTSGAMKSFIRAMCLYPLWLKKLQEEVDQVVGGDRVPDFKDLPSLPTVRAAIKEVLRWRPVVPGSKSFVTVNTESLLNMFSFRCAPSSNQGRFLRRLLYSKGSPRPRQPVGGQQGRSHLSRPRNL